MKYFFCTTRKEWFSPQFWTNFRAARKRFHAPLERVSSTSRTTRKELFSQFYWSDLFYWCCFSRWCSSREFHKRCKTRLGNGLGGHGAWPAFLNSSEMQAAETVTAPWLTKPMLRKTRTCMLLKIRNYTTQQHRPQDKPLDSRSRGRFRLNREILIFTGWWASYQSFGVDHDLATIWWHGSGNACQD